MVSQNVSERDFLDRHAPLVYNLALRLVGNPTDAEDLAQDALLLALKALPNFRGDSSLSTWMYRITVNTWKNRVRSEKRRGLWKMLSLNLFTGEEQDEEPNFKAEEPAIDAGAQTAETGVMVQKALLQIDDDSRAVVLLRDIEGQTYQEIAKTLEIPEGTVKSRLWRARDALRKILEKDAV